MSNSGEATVMNCNRAIWEKVGMLKDLFRDVKRELAIQREAARQINVSDLNRKIEALTASNKHMTEAYEAERNKVRNLERKILKLVEALKVDP